MRLRQSALAPFRCSAQVLGGRYRLDGVIGSGGAGDVHRGFDLRLRRPVAVKVFHVGTGGGEDDFHNEAVILARLQHPGLVTVYDAGRHDGRAYLVMELIEGPTLKARIAGGPLAPGETAALGAGLARALAHAHDAGIVHRDVKPSNIILDPSGRPHLTDFGISLLLDATTRTTTGTLIGTAAYLSPEQVLGRPVGPSADVYALGLVLLECLTGRLEYDGAPLEAAIARLHRRPELPESLPEEFAALLGDMTALDAQARPSADDCVRALAALAALAEPNGPRAVPHAAEVTSLVPEQAPAWADRTHPHAPRAGGTVVPKAPPARGRYLVAGTAAALAAAVAATVAVSDGPAHHASARAVSSPSTKAEAPGTSAPGDEAGSAPAERTARDVPAGRLHAPGPDQPPSPASAYASAARSREPATDTTVHGPTTPPAPGTAPDAPGRGVARTSETAVRGKKGADHPGERSDKSRKADKGHEGHPKTARKKNPR
ncbi:protein kinase [Streptomyces sp. Go40/10]|uniref:serine/threonine-protein kinase n=1 Tax=Streptomyces sp. Go40/10 TaxID=2825844 RepID=UPI001E57DE86|nr:serine/threonine-protein kinase [Streptomyces sp. Go40/10]UFR06213.1 protein kinase [Streptomyces sp. Go40/10]